MVGPAADMASCATALNGIRSPEHILDGCAHCRRMASGAWIIVLVAGLFEIVWATLMKQSDGFTKLWPSIGTVFTMLVSFALLAQAMRTLPLGTAYAVWTGVGAVGAAIVGIVFLGEPRSALRLLCIGAIVAGIGGLKATSGV